MGKDIVYPCHSTWSVECVTVVIGVQKCMVVLCIDILKYLVSQGIYPDEYTSARAAKNGDLETLKWLRENGCPWDTKCRRTTHAHIQTYLDENGCPT